MKAIIYCFSGTGNTERICSLYKEEFEKNGVETTVYPVTAERTDLPKASAYDYVGFAYPIHAFNAPKIMLELAREMERAEGKEIFILKSSGEPLKINNVSSLKMMSILKKKGYVLTNEYHYIMPYNMIFRHTDREAVRMWETAKLLCPVEAREVLARKGHKLSHIPLGRAFSWALRIEHPSMMINGRFFKVKKDKCVHCGKCEKACPVGNIKIEEEGSFRFGTNCLMCARCSFDCPTDAISIGVLNKWRVNGKYPLDKPLNDSIPERKHKHGWYCKKAYARYYAAAAKKCAEQETTR